MPGNYKKEDLRIIKTRRALFAALLNLLNRHAFAKITVYDVCDEALVSRTAFYAHFKDKFDLLEQWLNGFRERFLEEFSVSSRDEMESRISTDFKSNFAMIENLIKDADREQLNLLLRFLTPKIGNQSDVKGARPADRNIVASNFLAGGIFNAIYYQIREQRHASNETIGVTLDCVEQIMKMFPN
jgi:AcrR family transcriptional regulator